MEQTRKEKREREYDNELDEEPSLKKQDITNTYRIPVNGKYSVQYGDFCLCSYEDFEKLSKHKWYWISSGYACSSIRRTTVYMARFILDAPKGVVVDHINHNKSDNRRENLRIATTSQNGQNKTKRENCSSKYYGVYRKTNNSFCSRIMYDGVSYHLGSFKNEIDAAKIYDIYVVQNRDRLNLFHSLNFPNNIEDYKLAKVVEVRKKKKPNYNYVKKWGKNFMTSMTINGTLMKLGVYDNPEKAARAADKYIVDNKFNKPLNFPEEYPSFEPIKEEKQKIFMLEIDHNDKKICDILKNIAKCSPLENLNPNVDIIVRFGVKNQKYTLIEKSFFDTLKYHRFTLNNYGYVSVSKNNKTHLLSRFLFEDIISKDDCVDHIRSNILDNRKRFLKIVTHGDNSRNKQKRSTPTTSKFIGVHKKRNKWVASLRYNGIVAISKCMANEIDAGRFRDLFIIHHYPTDNYRMNFNDWSKKTIIEWKEKLKQHIYWIEK